MQARPGWAVCNHTSGCARSCPLRCSLSRRQENAANVLDSGNYVLILDFLHYHQPHWAWLTALGNLLGAKQIKLYFILDHWAAGEVLTAP